MRKRFSILGIVAVVAVTACSAVREPEGGSQGLLAAGPRAEPERTLVIGLRVEPSSLSPKPLSGGGVKIKTSTRLFNAALELIDDRGTAQPYLAEALPEVNTDRWRLFPDGRMETTYRLRPNLAWHDGVPFTAQDYVFSWRVYSTPDLGQANTLPISALEEVIAPDDRTVVMRWRQPYPGAGVLQEGGTISRFPALPRHALQSAYDGAQWESFMNHPYWTRDYVGLGPYRLERWEPGESIEGVAFDAHVLGRPKIGQLRLIFVADANAGLANLLSGAIHVAADDAVGIAQGVTAKREWSSTSGRSGGGLIVVAEVWRAVHAQFRPDIVSPRSLLDVRVRRALAHALDKDALNEALFDGEGVLASTIFPPTVDYYPVIDRAIVKYPYDRRRSEQLMAEAGFVKGAGGFYESPAEGRFMPELKTNASAQNESERSILAARWRDAGFGVEEGLVSASQARDIQVRSTYRSLYNYGRGLGTGNLPNFSRAAIAGPENRWTGSNRGGWSNPEYDRLFESFNATLDRNQGIQLLAQIATIMSDELPAFPLYYDLGPVVYLGSVRGPRQVSPDTSGLVSWNIHEWELRP